MDLKKRLGDKLRWRVDDGATFHDATGEQAAPPDPAHPSAAGGRVVFVDENGARRRLPADMSQLAPEQRNAAIEALSQALGAGPPGYARTAAIERLTELRVAGRLSEEQFQKERRRLEDLG